MNTRKVIVFSFSLLVVVIVVFSALFFISFFSFGNEYVAVSFSKISFLPLNVSEFFGVGLSPVSDFNHRVRGLSDSCGLGVGNCNVCLECVSTSNSVLSEGDFISGKGGVCSFIPAQGVDVGFCESPLFRCSGDGECVECLTDDDCSACDSCVTDFAFSPWKSDAGKCIPKLNARGEFCR